MRATRFEAANAALETLQALRRHETGCTQCRLDPMFCSTRQQYRDSFERDYKAWERSET